MAKHPLELNLCSCNLNFSAWTFTQILSPCAPSNDRDLGWLQLRHFPGQILLGDSMGGILAWNCVFFNASCRLAAAGRKGRRPWPTRTLARAVRSSGCTLLTSNLTLWLLDVPVVNSWPLDGLNDVNPLGTSRCVHSGDHGMARLTKMQKKQKCELDLSQNGLGSRMRHLTITFHGPIALCVPTEPPQLSLGSEFDSVSLSQDRRNARLRRRQLVGLGCLALSNVVSNLLACRLWTGPGFEASPIWQPRNRIGGTQSLQAVLQLPTAKHTPSTHHVPNTWLRPPQSHKKIWRRLPHGPLQFLLQASHPQRWLLDGVWDEILAQPFLRKLVAEAMALQLRLGVPEVRSGRDLPTTRPPTLSPNFTSRFSARSMNPLQSAMISVNGYSCATTLAFTKAFLIASTSAPCPPMRPKPAPTWTRGRTGGNGTATVAKCSKSVKQRRPSNNVAGLSWATWVGPSKNLDPPIWNRDWTPSLATHETTLGRKSKKTKTGKILMVRNNQHRAWSEMAWTKMAAFSPLICEVALLGVPPLGGVAFFCSSPFGVFLPPEGGTALFSSSIGWCCLFCVPPGCGGVAVFLLLAFCCLPFPFLGGTVFFSPSVGWVCNVRTVAKWNMEDNEEIETTHRKDGLLLTNRTNLLEMRVYETALTLWESRTTPSSAPPWPRNSSNELATAQTAAHDNIATTSTSKPVRRIRRISCAFASPTDTRKQCFQRPSASDFVGHHHQTTTTPCGIWQLWCRQQPSEKWQAIGNHLKSSTTSRLLRAPKRPGSLTIDLAQHVGAVNLKTMSPPQCLVGFRQRPSWWHQLTGKTARRRGRNGVGCGKCVWVCVNGARCSCVFFSRNVQVTQIWEDQKCDQQREPTKKRTSGGNWTSILKPGSGVVGEGESGKKLSFGHGWNWNQHRRGPSAEGWTFVPPDAQSCAGNPPWFFFFWYIQPQRATTDTKHGPAPSANFVIMNSATILMQPPSPNVDTGGTTPTESVGTNCLARGPSLQETLAR